MSLKSRRQREWLHNRARQPKADYPVGEVSPSCVFRANRDRCAGARLSPTPDDDIDAMSAVVDSPLSQAVFVDGAHFGPS